MPQKIKRKIAWHRYRKECIRTLSFTNKKRCIKEETSNEQVNCGFRNL
jgi:hypothetical protein